MAVLKLMSVGTSTGVVIPKEMLNRLKLEKGDALFATETKDGYMLTPYDPVIEEQIKIGRQVAKEYRQALRELAK